MNTFFRLFLASTALLLTCCSGGVKTINLYNNDKTAVEGDLQITYKLNHEMTVSKQVYLSFDIYFLSSNPKPLEIRVKAAKVYREKDKAEYGDFPTYLGLTLNCDIEKELSFSCTLPTDTKTDNYYFRLDFNQIKLIHHFYDKTSSTAI